MKAWSDNPNYYDSEAAYMPMGSLGADTTTASTTPSWWQNLITNASQAYATVKNAQTAAKTTAAPAQPAPVTAGPSSQQILLYTGLGVGALFLVSMMLKKRR